MTTFFERFSNTDLSVAVSELLVATADSSDPLVDGSVTEVLKAVRDRLGMDVVFVSEFLNGKRMFRFVDSAPGAPVIRAGDSNLVEETYCQMVVDGRLPELINDADALPPVAGQPPVPFRVGGHLSTPIPMPSGHTYGTLCCFSTQPRPELRIKDLETLRMCAVLVARKLEHAQKVLKLKEPPPEWALEPQSTYGSKVWNLA